jgi:hypothetical protein
MTGTVTDAFGASIANATVTFTNESAGAQRVITVDNDGTYIAVGLEPAVYARSVCGLCFSQIALALSECVFGSLRQNGNFPELVGVRS